MFNDPSMPLPPASSITPKLSPATPTKSHPNKSFDSTSSYDESWPNLVLETTSRNVVSMETEQPTLARYIHRFRTAPPTRRDRRPQTPKEEFWWREEKKELPCQPSLVSLK